LGNHQELRLQDLRLSVPQSFHPLIDDKGFLRTYPKTTLDSDDYRLDGFFAARLVRT
jgi:16S rRNA C967 or C1407 C5-methylase (RsmB/RsmF family)